MPKIDPRTATCEVVIRPLCYEGELEILVDLINQLGRVTGFITAVKNTKIQYTDLIKFLLQIKIIVNKIKENQIKIKILA